MARLQDKLVRHGTAVGLKRTMGDCAGGPSDIIWVVNYSAEFSFSDLPRLRFKIPVPLFPVWGVHCRVQGRTLQ